VADSLFAVHPLATRSSSPSLFFKSLEKFFSPTISRRASAPTGKFWLTFDDEILSMMTLVSRLARLHHHFFLDFIFQ